MQNECQISRSELKQQHDRFTHAYYTSCNVIITIKLTVRHHYWKSFNYIQFETSKQSKCLLPTLLSNTCLNDMKLVITNVTAKQKPQFSAVHQCRQTIRAKALYSMNELLVSDASVIDFNNLSSKASFRHAPHKYRGSFACCCRWQDAVNILSYCTLLFNS